MRRVTAWQLLCVLVLVACGGADQPAPARPGPLADPEFVNGQECPPSRHAELPDDAGCVSSATREDERLLVYALLDSAAKPRSWRLRFESGDAATDRRLLAGNVTSYPRALGATDLNSDGSVEWWIKVADYASHGAAWAGLNLFVSAGDGLTPVTYEGEPLTINFGGISRLGEGAECRGDELVALRVWARDRQNTKWWVSERRYAITGTTATFLGRRRVPLVIETYSDPDLARNYRVECGGQTFTPY